MEISTADQSDNKQKQRWHRGGGSLGLLATATLYRKDLDSVA